MVPPPVVIIFLRIPFAGFSLASGIFALLSLCGFFFPLAIVLGVGAVLLAVLAKRQDALSAPSVIGIVLGVISVVLGAAEFAFLLYFFDLLKEPQNIALFNQLFQETQAQLRQLQGLQTLFP